MLMFLPAVAWEIQVQLAQRLEGSFLNIFNYSQYQNFRILQQAFE